MTTSSQPTQFGRYQLLELLAKGGMAEVFKARMDGAAGTEKLVCIKRILPHLSHNSDFISLFVREAKITLPLSHGNITQVFDFGEVDGLYFLAMEYIRGRNLAQMLQRLKEKGGGLDVPMALWIGAEVCRGLHYAHSYTDANGKSVVVVHRDLSPHNVLISLNGEVKLTDFGIALAASKAAEDDAVVRGKPCYVSPEQAAGRAADPRSDVFSMGSVLYEMLTGVRPFEKESDAETLACVARAEPEPPSKHNEMLDEDLDAIVLKALARDPQQRYQRAGDLQVALSRLLHAHAPDFTADNLAQRVKELFGWELTEDQGEGARERLLYQLARAGVEVEDRNAKTDELLQMGTVAIGAAPMPKVVTPPDADRAPRAPWIAIALLALLGCGYFLYGALAGGDPPDEVDAGVNLAKLPTEDPTEHLTPKSLRKARSAPPVKALDPKGPASKVPQGHKAAAKKTAPTTKAAQRRQVGYLNCNSWPWSVVYLNGKRLPGNTPIYRVKVAAGKHRLRFENPELRLSKEQVVVVAPGSVRTVAVSLQQ